MLCSLFHFHITTPATEVPRGFVLLSKRALGEQGVGKGARAMISKPGAEH